MLTPVLLLRRRIRRGSAGLRHGIENRYLLKKLGWQVCDHIDSVSCLIALIVVGRTDALRVHNCCRVMLGIFAYVIIMRRNAFRFTSTIFVDLRSINSNLRFRYTNYNHHQIHYIQSSF